MSGETQGQEASVSLAAGFNKVRGDEHPTPKEPDVKQEPVQTAEAPEAKPEAQPEQKPEGDKPQGEVTAEEKPEVKQEPNPEDEEILPGVTKAQMKALLAEVPSLRKANDSLSGRVGQLVRTIKQLQPAAEKAGGEGASARQSQAETFKKLREQYPEIAEALADDLQAAMPKGSGPDPKQIEELVESRVASVAEVIERKAERKALSRAHPDWETVVTSPDFNLWKATLPSQEQQAFETSWDSDVVGSYVKRFKDHRAALTARVQQKQTRLETAVTPQGVPGSTASRLPDSAGLSAGFNRVRGVRL